MQQACGAGAEGRRFVVHAPRVPAFGVNHSKFFLLEVS
jgi:hypothetical protein